MNIALRIAAAILSVPPDVLAPFVPMMAPPPRNGLEIELRNEVDSALSGSCCRSSSFGGGGGGVDEHHDVAPLFAISREEAQYVDCKSGLPPTSMEEGLFNSGIMSEPPSTYGEITSLGSRQLFHYMGLMNDAKSYNQNDPKHQFFDLGSGGGRLVIQSFLELPSVYKSVGIELSPSRHQVAIQTWTNLVQNGDAVRIRALAEKSWDVHYLEHAKDEAIECGVELHEGDLFDLDISQATHLYISSLCFSEDMLLRIVEKIETEGVSLQIVASLRLLPLGHGRDRENASLKRVSLGRNPWMEYVEMSWTKARGDGCRVYLYTVITNADDKGYL